MHQERLLHHLNPRLGHPAAAMVAALAPRPQQQPAKVPRQQAVTGMLVA
jgi:hypothetical protein